MERANILGCGVDLISMEEAVAAIEKMVESGRPHQVITLNAEIIYQAREDADLQGIINSADLVTPDGIGVVWAAGRLGHRSAGRVTGIDLLERLAARSAQLGWKVYLLGSAPGVAEAAGRILQDRYRSLNVVGTHHGYFKPDEVPALLQEINHLTPDLLCVALGAPGQEIWIDHYKEQLGVPVMIGVGGSLDVIGGFKQRAPELFIKLNLEWFYRLVSEPSRLKRQMVLPRFAMQVIREKYRKSS
ncbi:MAG: WecB/TagA/CpsF family glycosyltransferase [Deltaproteobacteria bacterium]